MRERTDVSGRLPAESAPRVPSHLPQRPSAMTSERDPCPDRILDDIGGAFSMGAIGGGVWHSVKGWRNSPRGERMLGSVTAIRARVPVIGGNFAVWGGLFSVFDCSLVAIRHKEDPWNSIISAPPWATCRCTWRLARCIALRPGGRRPARDDRGAADRDHKMLADPAPAPLGPPMPVDAAPPPIMAPRLPAAAARRGRHGARPADGGMIMQDSAPRTAAE